MSKNVFFDRDRKNRKKHSTKAKLWFLALICKKIDKTYRLLHKFLENLMLIKKKSFKIDLFLLLLNYYLESL